MILHFFAAFLVLYVIGALALLSELRQLAGDDFAGEVGVLSWVFIPVLRGIAAFTVLIAACASAVWRAPYRLTLLRRLRRTAAYVRNGGNPPATYPTDSYIDGCVSAACDEASTDFGRFLVRPYTKGTCACGAPSAVLCGTDALCRQCLRRMVAEHYEGGRIQRQPEDA